MSAVPSQVTTLDQLRQPAQAVRPPAVRTGFENSDSWELMQRQCKALAASTLVPQQFQNSLPNCLIALEMAQRIGASPLMVMQNLYVVHGRPGWSAKFLIASFNQCGRFSAIRFQWQGERNTDAWGCRAWATEKATGERIEGPWISIDLAKKEGWYAKSGSKWQTIPELMLSYRAAAWLVNTHAPEISMGLNTAEEIVDVYDTTRAADGQFQVDTGELRGQRPALDPDTGELRDERAANAAKVEQERTGPSPAAEGPSFEEVVRMIKAGNYDEALDVTKGEPFTDEQRANVAEMIRNHQAGETPAQQQQQRTARRTPGRGVSAPE